MGSMQIAPVPGLRAIGKGCMSLGSINEVMDTNFHNYSVLEGNRCGNKTKKKKETS
jgi:hypothetical protein